jgi:hypothetical protein
MNFYNEKKKNIINYISIFDDWTGDSGMFEWSEERFCCPLINGNGCSRLPAPVVPIQKNIRLDLLVI